MIIELCFICSFVVCMMFTIKIGGELLGKSMYMPLPILNLLGVGTSNTYVFTPAVAFQVWFWSHHYGLFI